MKVISNCVTVENESFALIYDEQQGRKFYGTIPHSDIDESGRLTKVLNGFQMCIADTKEHALESRRFDMVVKAYRSNHTEQETLDFMLTGNV